MLLPVQTVRNQRVRRFPQEPVGDVLAEIAGLKRGSVSGVMVLGNPIDAGLGFRAAHGFLEPLARCRRSKLREVFTFPDVGSVRYPFQQLWANVVLQAL
jgi:hypothetical protein